MWLAGRPLSSGPRRLKKMAPPDWSRIEGYSALYSAIPKVDFPDQQAFVHGPLERYLELVEAEPGRAGARIMEHLSASVRWFRESEAAQGRSTEWLDEAVAALVRERFASGSENDKYMIEVFEGRATHNYRASDEHEED
jgi:hypothetical protein